jgi:hypothetical protein
MQIDLALAHFEGTVEMALKAEEEKIAENKRQKFLAAQEAKTDLQMSEMAAEMGNNGQRR